MTYPFNNLLLLVTTVATVATRRETYGELHRIGRKGSKKELDNLPRARARARGDGLGSLPEISGYGRFIATSRRCAGDVLIAQCQRGKPSTARGAWRASTSSPRVGVAIVLRRRGLLLRGRRIGMSTCAKPCQATDRHTPLGPESPELQAAAVDRSKLAMSGRADHGGGTLVLWPCLWPECVDVANDVCNRTSPCK